MRLYLYKPLLFLSIVFSSFIVHADIYESGPFKIKSIRVAETKVYVQFEPALQACEGGTHYRMHTVTSSENTALVSTILATYLSQKTIKYVFARGEGSPCSSAHVLTLYMLEVY